MTTLHSTNALNVEASVNNWLNTQLNAITKPSWLPSLAIVFNMPETGILTPGISVFHMPIAQRNRWQGGHVGEGRVGARAANLMDVSCWVSRGDSTNWNAQLMTLRSMVMSVFAGKSSLQLSDYLSDPANATAVAYKVDFGPLDGADTQHDPNPDIERARFLIRYDWTIRSVA